MGSLNIPIATTNHRKTKYVRKIEDSNFSWHDNGERYKAIEQGQEEGEHLRVILKSHGKKRGAGGNMVSKIRILKTGRLGQKGDPTYSSDVYL